MNGRRRPIPLLPILILVPILFAAEARAQEREIEATSIPRNMADRLIAVANDPATFRLPGDSHVPADSVLRGDVVVMGSLRLGGRVEGDLIVIHGDLEMEAGASVLGDLSVIQGQVRGEELAAIGGTLVAYRSDSRLVRRGAHTREVREEFPRVRREVSAELPGSHRARTASSSFRFSVQGGDYNRVEGLPVIVGPILNTGGRSPFRAETRLIWRTEGHPALAHDRIGYDVRGEQFLGAGRLLRIGGGVYSVVDPIEAWGLGGSENAWATFLLTDDQRDHFERRGWRAGVRVTPRELPLDLTLEYRDEQHGAVGVGDPWTLFRSGRDWRLQPLVAEGSLRSAVVGLEVDTRDDHSDPLDGWLVRASWRQGLGGSIIDSDSSLEEGFAAAFLDVRRYHAVGRRGAFALRGVLGGAVNDQALPPQFQHALGGVGSLPGHATFAGDCGARSSVVPVERDGREATMFTSYGCDRFALAQVEYRGPLNLHLGFNEPRDDGQTRRHRRSRGGMNWAVFFNAGQGWSVGDPPAAGRADTEALYDAGLALLFGSGGIYWATPLGNAGGESRFTLRLNRRF